MKKNNIVTINDLMKTACWHLNKHLEEKPPPPEKKKLGRPPANVSAALTKLSWDVSIWAKVTGHKLEREYRFHEFRKFRFDFAFPDIKVAVEFEGGIFLQTSGHNTAKHYDKDVEKYNLAIESGWRVLRYTALSAKNAYQDLENLKL